jgi:hypothetical protein
VGRVYSTRFLLSADLSSAISYVVPDGNVAVLKCVSGAGGSDGGEFLVVLVEGAIVILVPLEEAAGESYTSGTWTGMVVCNPGEIVELAGTGDSQGQVSGYLLTQ